MCESKKMLWSDMLILKRIMLNRVSDWSVEQLLLELCMNTLPVSWSCILKLCCHPVSEFQSAHRLKKTGDSWVNTNRFMFDLAPVWFGILATTITEYWKLELNYFCYACCSYYSCSILFLCKGNLEFIVWLKLQAC